jgi:hypothetical protein
VYSLLFTSLVSFVAYAIIPDGIRPQYFDNLISGIAMNVIGPVPLKLLYQAFVVLVGFLMLAGAVNTAIVGSNGVLQRVSEDGVLTDWFRLPHELLAKFSPAARRQPARLEGATLGEKDVSRCRCSCTKAGRK